MVSLVKESMIFTITIITAYIYFKSLELNKSNHIVKVFAEIHYFTSTINPNGKQSVSQITFQLLAISVHLYGSGLACKSRYTVHINKTPVYREKKLPKR
jgi:uncharacterized membrane protein